MRTMRLAGFSTRKRSAFALGIIFVVCSQVRGDVNIVYNPAGNRTLKSQCDADDGSSQLDPANVQRVAPPTAGATVLKTLTNNFPGWTFTGGASLNGTLTINYYWSKFYSTHNSGARIHAVYAPATNDPATLRWVQLVETTAPKTGITNNTYIDQDPDAPASNKVPFYYDETKFKKFTDIHFQDFSHRPHPPTSSVKWHGTFYLSSWDGGTPGTVTLHDGFYWGWIGGCAAGDATNTSLKSSPTPGNNNFTLTWPTNSPGTNLRPWKVESAQNLQNPFWRALTNAPEVSDGVFRLVLPVVDAQEFFRLSLDTTELVPGPVAAYVAEPPQTNLVEQSHEAFLFCRSDGDDPISYQWFFNGDPILNATNGFLDLVHVQFGDQGTYSVMASNAFGSDLSDPAFLTVIADTNPPVLISAAASSNRAQITVAFSEGVAPAGALNPNNYQVQSSIGATVFLLNAIPGTNGNLVVLLPSMVTPLLPQTSYTLRASSNITDLATPPNPLPAGSLTMFQTGP